MIDGAVLGDDAFAAEVLAPLRALRPEFDTVRACPRRRCPGCTWTPRARPGVRQQHPRLRPARRRRRRRGRGGRTAVGTPPGRRRAPPARWRRGPPGPRRRRAVSSTGRSWRSAWAWARTLRRARGRRGSWPPSSRGRPAGSTCRCSTSAPTPGRSFPAPGVHARLSAVRAAWTPTGCSWPAPASRRWDGAARRRNPPVKDTGPPVPPDVIGDVTDLEDTVSLRHPHRRGRLRDRRRLVRDARAPD